MLTATMSQPKLDQRSIIDPPRLQIFVHDLSATGVVRNAIAIANQAAGRGYAVRLLTAVPDGALRELVSASVELVGLMPRGLTHMPRGDQLRRSREELRRRTMEWKPHILFSAGNHAHKTATKAWFGLPGIKILRISNALGHNLPRWSWRLLRRRLRFALMTGLSDRVVLISRQMESDPAFAGLLRSGKARVITNGVAVERVRRLAAQPCPHPWFQGGQEPVVLAVGRIVEQKNLGLLVRALAHARRQRPLRLVVLGEGSPEARERLRSLAGRLGVEDALAQLPPTPNPFPYVAAADVVALPSWWEGSSNVILESMACGTPVVAARTAGDAWHVLDEGRYGVLIDPDDAHDLAAALLRQTGPDPIRPGDRVLDFTAEAALRSYMDLLDEAASEARRSRKANP